MRRRRRMGEMYNPFLISAFLPSNVPCLAAGTLTYASLQHSRYNSSKVCVCMWDRSCCRKTDFKCDRFLTTRSCFRLPLDVCPWSSEDPVVIFCQLYSGFFTFVSMLVHLQSRCANLLSFSYSKQFRHSPKYH